MDLWTYLGALRRWWWLALGIPAVVLAITIMVLPPAPWQTQFGAFIVYPGNPEKSNSAKRWNSVVLDDLAALMRSDAVAERVQAQLPASLQDSLTAGEIGDMLSSSRYSREATVKITGDSPEEVRAVAEGVEAVLPDAVNSILRPPDEEAAEIEVVNRIEEPVRLTTPWLLKLGAVTAAGGAAALLLIGLMEHLRLSYREQRDARAS